MGKPAFHEDYHNQHTDPVEDHSIADFDWDELLSRLGEPESELSQRDYEGLVKALRSILKWLLGADLDRREPERMIGRRTIALVWALNPALFKHNPSLTKLANRLGIAKATLSVHASHASRKFQLTNEYHAHNWRTKTRR